ncbi:Capsid protein VP1, partial [Bienertia sinuspersici]
QVAANLLERFGSVVYFDGESKTDGPQKVVRARVRIQLNSALIPGCYLELEQGRTKWIHFRYEGVFVFYLHCGKIGHKDSYYRKSPKKAKEDIIRASNNVCTEENDRIINESSIIPVYSKKVRGLKGTPGNKTTSVNLVLPTHSFTLEDMLFSSDSDEDDKDDEDDKVDEGEGDEDDDDNPWPDHPGGGPDPNGSQGPSKKRPSSSNGSNSSDPSDDVRKPPKMRKKELHEGFYVKW